MVARFLTSCEVRPDDVLLKADGTPLTVGDVKSRISLWLAERGAEQPEGCIFAIGKDAGVPHSVGNPEDLVRLGRTIVFDIFPSEAGGGYFYDFTRTWTLGYAAPRQARSTPTSRMCMTRWSRTWTSMPPSRNIRMACDEFHERGHRTPMHDEGLLENGYVHSLGHGVGLNIHERPSSRHTASDDNRLRAGVVVTIEPGLYYPEKGWGCASRTLLGFARMARWRGWPSIHMTSYCRWKTGGRSRMPTSQSKSLGSDHA